MELVEALLSSHAAARGSPRDSVELEARLGMLVDSGRRYVGGVPEAVWTGAYSMLASASHWTNPLHEQRLHTVVDTFVRSRGGPSVRRRLDTTTGGTSYVTKRTDAVGHWVAVSRPSPPESPLVVDGVPPRSGVSALDGAWSASGGDDVPAVRVVVSTEHEPEVSCDDGPVELTRLKRVARFVHKRAWSIDVSIVYEVNGPIASLSVLSDPTVAPSRYEVEVECIDVDVALSLPSSSSPSKLLHSLVEKVMDMLPSGVVLVKRA